ncbi:GroES-like protein [Pilatotrama ljubarskyi]|nr:GroES-like protein [Pilatotrama ljubarskyi]
MDSPTIPTTMRAAVYRPGNQNLVLDGAYPVPQPKTNQVLLRVAACGACHSDTFLLSNAFIDDRSYVFGHETVGYAVQCGEDVKDIEEGRLYAVYAIRPCAARTGTFPPIEDSTGIGQDGGFAEYVLVDERQLVPVPPGLKPEIAAVASDSLITAYNAVYNVAGLRPWTKKRVLIYGVGGVGHQALQLAKHYGATVFAVDFKPAARELALKVGAERALTLSELSREAEAGQFTVDVVNRLPFSLAMAATKNNAFEFTKPPSKIVLVGVSAELLPLISADVIEYNIQVPGVVKPLIERAPLEDVDQALNDLRASAVLGRRIILPTLHRA